MKNHYIKEILTEYQDRLDTANAVLVHNGVFPDRKNPMKKLSLIQELIIKTTYLLKVNFLEETALLYAFAYSKPQIEKAILELETQDYLYSQTSPEFGKAIALTRQALYYIKHHPEYSTVKKDYQELSINKDAIPKETGIMKYKITASYMSQKVFYSRLTLMVQRFIGLDKATRQSYCREQYVKYFVYKDFLTLDTQSKTTYLEELGFGNEIIIKYANSSLFSNTFCQNFAKQYISIHGEDSIELLSDYQVLKKKVNQGMKKKPYTGDFLFHFLKDFINENATDKDNILSDTFQSLQSNISNMLRDKDIEFRDALISCTSKQSGLIHEKLLYLYGEKKRVLTIQRRNLIKTNAFKNDKEEETLNEATNKLILLDNELESTEKHLQRLEEEFLLYLYERINPEGANQGKEKVVTFHHLKSSSIYINSIIKGELKPIITFVIVSSTNDPIEVTSLFQRLEKIWCFYYKWLLEYDFRIELLCYGEQRTNQTTKTLKKALEWIAEFREYQLLHLLLPERIHIKNCEFHPKERYEVFRELSKQMSGTDLTAST